MKRGFFLSILFIIFLSAVNISVFADNLIKPGIRIDGAYMDMNFDLILRGWGQPDEKQEVSGGMTIYKNKKYQTIFYVIEGKLAMIETFSSSFKTDSGIKVGSQRLDLTDRLGAPLDQENYSFTFPDGSTRDLYALIYKGIGIGFSFDPYSNKVLSVFVFPVGKYISHSSM